MTHRQPEEEVLLTPEVLSETLENIEEKLTKARKHLDLTKQMFPFLDKESERKVALKKRRTLETEVRMLETAQRAKSQESEVPIPVGVSTPSYTRKTVTPNGHNFKLT